MAATVELTPEHQACLDLLVAELPADCLVTDPDLMAGFRWDYANDPEAGVPLAVARVRNTEQVQTVVRLAARFGIPVVPRGAGTGLSGGSTAQNGAITLSLDRMREIAIDSETRTAVVQPGLLNAEVKAAAAAAGLWYPPDPSSYEICSIGGNIATNAGGLCCVKYGVTTDYVLGMQVVLADGTAVRLGGPRLKDVAGLSLTKLFVGSEGTLGIITEVTLRLLPAQPRASIAVASFASIDDATNAVMAISRSLRPSIVELMDKVSINAVEDVTNMGLDRAAEALLIVGSDSQGSAAVAELSIIEELLAEHNASDIFVTDDPDTGEAFIAARRMAIPCVEKKGALLLEDVGVPVPQLGALIRGIAEISAALDVIVAVVAHAGDGNTHPLIVHDPTDADQTARANVAFGEIMSLAIALGGTITGEHGVGRLKKAWLPEYLGEDAMMLNRRIKQALDPANILNPGAIF
jgi:glycolate oxidase